MTARTSKTADLLEGLEFFSGFSHPELETLARHLGHVSATKGDVMFNEGDPGNYMLILVDGKISVFKAGAGERHLFFSEGRGRIFGEMALLDRENRSATCVADDDCELLTLSQEGLEALAAESPLLAYRLMFGLARLLSKRLRLTSGVLAEHVLG